MRGLYLRIRWDEFREADSLLPEGVSSFAFFFKPVLPSLADFTWIVDPVDGLPLSEGFCFDSDCEREFDNLPEDHGLIPANTLLPKFARYIKDDWLDLYGFREPIKDSTPFLREFSEACREVNAEYADFRKSTPEAQYLAATVDIYIRNVDGSYWTVYARDEQLLDSISRYASGIPGVTCFEISLLEGDL